MILYIAIGVCAGVFVIWLVGVLWDGRKERRRVREFQQDVAMQERTYRPIFKEEGHGDNKHRDEDNDTKPYPTDEQIYQAMKREQRRRGER